MTMSTRRKTVCAHANPEFLERMLQTLLDNLPGMAYRMRNTPDWPAEFISTRCLELTGYPAESLMNGQVQYGDLIVPEDRITVWNHVQRALHENRSFELIYRIEAAGGQVKWVWERGCGIFDEDGQTVAVEGFITDITERKTTEAELRKSIDRYRSIFQNALVGLYRSTPKEGYILECNDYVARMLGYDSRQDCMDDYVFGEHYVDPSVRKRMIRILRDIGTIHDFEAQLTRRNGEPIWVRYSARLNQAEGYLEGVILDITTRKQAELQLEAKQESLGKKDIALQEVLSGIEAEKTHFTRQIMENIERLIMPLIAVLRRETTESQLQYIELLENNLKTIADPIAQKLTNEFTNLTPTEIRICELIRQGLSTKEIARTERLSAGTINVHREHIRRKLGLTNTKVNMATYLRSHCGDLPTTNS